MLSVAAARAYKARTADRNLRDQEADVFRRANASLRVAQSGTELDRVRALADNQLLWGTVMALLKDPDNALPDSLKSAIISVGHTVKRELGSAQPDLAFVMTINDHIAAGLTSA